MPNRPEYRILPVILSGGSGFRLWPLSRQALPKQFLPLTGSESLLVQTARRVASKPNFLPPLIIASDEHRFIVAEQFRVAGLAPQAILLEPNGRNTAPAAAVAAHYGSRSGEDVLVLLLPADHFMAEGSALAAAVNRAAPAAAAGAIGVFGVQPNSPETGFGYVMVGPDLADHPEVHRVAGFVEKPDLATARRYLADGGYLWNAGIFLFSPGSMIAELNRLHPRIADHAAASLEQAEADLDFHRLAPEPFGSMPAISIDHAVMEHTKRAIVTRLETSWSDIGAWAGLWGLADKDDAGNALFGEVVAIDTKGSYVRSEDGRLIATLGVEDHVIISTDDALMVVHRSRSDDVRTLVDRLKAEGRKEATSHSRVYRPWGHYRTIDRGNGYQVKQIAVLPGAQLSLQKHFHRAEHWVVVNGTALVTKDGDEMLVRENESLYLPLGCVHRLANPGKVPLELIEIQSGTYLGEDDIVRFEDTYGRA